MMRRNERKICWEWQTDRKLAQRSKVYWLESNESFHLPNTQAMKSKRLCRNLLLSCKWIYLFICNHEFCWKSWHRPLMTDHRLFLAQQRHTRPARPLRVLLHCTRSTRQPYCNPDNLEGFTRLNTTDSTDSTKIHVDPAINHGAKMSFEPKELSW